MVTTIADAYVRIRPQTDPSAATKAGQDAGEKAGKGAGTSFNNSFKTLVTGAIGAVTAIAAGKVVGFFKDSVEAASDLNESTSKLKVVFGQASNSVLSFGKDSATSMGQSQRVYRDAVGTLGNLLVSLKLPQGEAAKMSTSMVKLAGDMASFNNTSPEQALEAIRSGLVGETEPLRAYGVNMNQATLKNEALKLGIIKTTKEALTPQQQALAAYGLIMNQTKTAQGDFARTSSGLANSQRILGAQFDDLKTKLGTIFLPIVNQIVGVIRANVMPAIDDFVNGLQGHSGLGSAASTAGVSLWAFYQSLRDGQVVTAGVAGDFERVGAAIHGIFGVLSQNKDVVLTLTAAYLAYEPLVNKITAATKAWAAAQALLDGTLEANPIGLIVAAIVGFVAAWVLAYNKVQWFHDAVNFWFGHIYQLALWLWHNGIEPAFAAIGVIWDNAKTTVQALGSFFQSVFSGISSVVMGFWHNAVEPAWHGIESAFNGIKAAGQTLWTVLQTIFNAIASVINATVVPVINMLWHSIFEPAFHAIAVIVQNAWTIVENIFKLWVSFIQIIMGPIVKTFGDIFKVVWDAIVVVARGAWTNIQGIWNLLVAFVQGPLTSVFRAFWDYLKSVWDGITLVISAAWNNAIKPIFTALGNYISDIVAPAFKRGVQLVGEAWKDIENLAKAPVNFVIGTVINRGIIDSLNWVTDKLGHGANLDHLQTLAHGGPVSGLRTASRKDNKLAAVQSGEYVMPVDKSAEYFPILEAMRFGYYSGGFADGGPIGAIVGAITGAVSMFTDPLGFIKDHTPVGDIVKNFGNSPFVSSLIGIPEKIFDAVKSWISDHLAALLGGGGPVALGSPGGDSVAAILAVARRFDPTASVSSGYRPGDPGYHGQGLAADIIGANMDAIAQGFYNISNRLLELIHSPSWFVKNGQRVGADFYASVFAEHFNHVHVAAYANALGFANGGIIGEKIWGIGQSGRRYLFGERGPETVTPGVGGMTPGVQLNIHIHGDVSEAHIHEIESRVNGAFNKLLTQIRTGRRK